MTGRVAEHDSDFFGHAEPVDYRHFLRREGYDFGLSESRVDDERIWITEADAHVAAGRLHALDWDSEFFGVPTGRLEGMFFRPDDPAPIETRHALVRRLVERADAHGFRHMTCRVRADDLFLIQALEEEGFRLADLLTVYMLRLGPGEASPAVEWTELRPLLKRSMRGMRWGRMFNDEKFDRETAERFYVEVARHYCANGAHVTLHMRDGAPAGAAIGIVDDEVSRQIGCRYGVLWHLIVAPESQGTGVGTALFRAFCRDFGARCDLLEIGTQIYNDAANRIYLKAGCVPRSHASTFHRWAERA